VVAPALPAGTPGQLDQPHVRAGLLVLADPAGLRLAFAGHRLRREDASAGDDEHPRQGDGMVAPAPAARARGAGQARIRPAGLPVPAPLLVWLQTGLLRAPLGPDRRSRAVPGSVLLTGQRLHRHQQHLRVRAGGTGPRRQAHRSLRRVLPAALLLVLREHADPLPGPVPDLWPAARDADQGAVGLRLLLRAVGTAVLQSPPGRPGIPLAALALLRWRTCVESVYAAPDARVAQELQHVRPHPVPRPRPVRGLVVQG